MKANNRERSMSSDRVDSRVQELDDSMRTPIINKAKNKRLSQSQVRYRLELSHQHI